MLSLSKQPKEMYLLSLIEMCQRFSFWGIANLLVLYLVQFYKFTDVKATHLYGLFTGFAFVLPLLGGYLADRTSYRASVIFGSVSTALGCFLVAAGSVDLMYAGLFFAAIGTSLFTPSIYAILGALYKNQHHLREGGFSIYYAAVNLGVFLAVFILGSLGHAGHWGCAFVVAGGVQLLGLLLFFKMMQNPLFENLHTERALKKAGTESRLSLKEKSRILVILILSLVSILFWMSYNQGWSSMSLFALRYTDRHLFGFEMPVSWLLSLESLYLIILAFPMAGLYTWLKKRKLDPSPVMKTVLSLVGMGLCFGLMMLGSNQIPAGADQALISPSYLITAYAFMAVSEMLLMPIGLSLVTHLSPHRYTALLVGAWYGCVGIAFYAGGVMAGWMSTMKELSGFFSIFVAISFIPAILLLFAAKKLNQMRHADSL